MYGTDEPTSSFGVLLFARETIPFTGSDSVLIFLVHIISVEEIDH
jgi:hypothetical protein